MKELRASYDYGAKVWDTLTEAKAQELVEGRNNQKVQRWSFILGAIQDNMNHYGNLVVYVRMNGLVPPRSANRQLTRAPNRHVKKSVRPVRQRGRTRQMVWRGALVAGILAGASGAGHAADRPPGAAIQQQLRSFATTGSVLYVAAHPDVENTQVIAYLARGRGYRTAYLSL